MAIQTLIEYYNHDTGEFVGEIDITKYGLELVRKIAPPKDDDPDYYDPYELTKEVFLLLQNKIPELKEHIYEKFAYCIQARSI
jgi:hypothetical protein